MLLWFVFCVSAIVPKVLKMLVFPSFLGFSGVAYYCSSGFGRFRCFCVSCVCSSLLCCFCFCFVCFVIGFVVVLFFVLFFFFSFFCFFVCFVFFVLFFGGFKGQVRWPKGPPHLALNPPYCLVFVFLLVVVFFCFLCLFFLGVLFFCFCFFGGFKGQVRWPKGPPHLALNPPYFFSLFFFVFSFAFSLFAFK